MKKQDLTYSISANITPKEAAEKISRVSEWWGKNIDAKSQKQNDIFTYHNSATWVTFKIAEVIPNKKIVWQVTDCYLSWINNKTEWNGTKIIWDIARKDDSTKIQFTHQGLIPSLECYNDCELGWSEYIKKSLFKFITKGKGLPDKF